MISAPALHGQRGPIVERRRKEAPQRAEHLDDLRRLAAAPQFSSQQPDALVYPSGDQETKTPFTLIKLDGEVNAQDAYKLLSVLADPLVADVLADLGETVLHIGAPPADEPDAIAFANDVLLFMRDDQKRLRVSLDRSTAVTVIRGLEALRAARWVEIYSTPYLQDVVNAEIAETAALAAGTMDFTKEGRSALEGFYANRQISCDPVARTAALREHVILQDMMVPAGDSVEDELKALEYYVLTEIWRFKE